MSESVFHVSIREVVKAMLRRPSLAQPEPSSAISAASVPVNASDGVNTIFEASLSLI